MMYGTGYFAIHTHAYVTIYYTGGGGTRLCLKFLLSNSNIGVDCIAGKI